MSYTNQKLISAFLKRDLSENEITYLAMALPAVDKWINDYTDSNFGDSTETTRYYDGGLNSIDIDPCIDISAVQQYDRSVDPAASVYDFSQTEYMAEPLNETVKRELRRRYGHFPTGAGVIAVTAKFTEYDDGVPVDIQLVATRLAASLFNTTANVDENGNAVKSETIEGHSITYGDATSSIDKVGNADPIVGSILNRYREILVD